MPIQTATPEQVEQCVLGLKRTVDSQAATIERQAAEIERLRGALEAVCSMDDEPDFIHRGYADQLARVRHIARAALEADHDG